jgi:hypothetical protein
MSCTGRYYQSPDNRYQGYPQRRLEDFLKGMRGYLRDRRNAGIRWSNSRKKARPLFPSPMIWIPVKALCQQTMLLNEGRIVNMDDTEKVIDDYLAMLQKK